MARPESFVVGNCYFSVAFYDQDLLLPMIDTLVYVGQEDDPEEGRMWLFKQPESESVSDDVAASSEPPTMVAFTDGRLHSACSRPDCYQRVIRSDERMRRLSRI